MQGPVDPVSITGLVPGHPAIVPVGPGVHDLGECAPSPLRGVERAVGVTFNKKIKIKVYGKQNKKVSP